MAMEERLSRLEGAYEHLATKADIAELKAAMAQMEVRLVRWGVGAIVGASAFVTVIVRLTG